MSFVVHCRQLAIRECTTEGVHDSCQQDIDRVSPEDVVAAIKNEFGDVLAQSERLHLDMPVEVG